MKRRQGHQELLTGLIPSLCDWRGRLCSGGVRWTRLWRLMEVLHGSSRSIG